MDKTIFSNIGKIIERDSKSTTYKFALLRGTIDIIQENSPFIYEKDGRIIIPTGLLIEKWLVYYYPILESEKHIPQINNSKKLKFQTLFDKLIAYYKFRGGLSVFYNDLRSKGVPDDIRKLFLDLVKSLKKTITDMPMRYIGKSVNNKEYSIYDFEKNITIKKSIDTDLNGLIMNTGSFSIPIEYYEVFKLLGNFVSGQDSILFKWANFSVTNSGGNLKLNDVLEQILKAPTDQRNTTISKNIYENIFKKKGYVNCVWTGNKIRKYDVDHVIPFSVWKNNDLWNLLPTKSTTNNNKRDKIPSPIMIEKQKDLILEYWTIIQNVQMQRFNKEIQVSLLGNLPSSSWKEIGINQLKQSCNYLIENRGFQEWKI